MVEDTIYIFKIDVSFSVRLRPMERTGQATTAKKEQRPKSTIKSKIAGLTANLQQRITRGPAPSRLI